jgi:hypothetical protein
MGTSPVSRTIVSYICHCSAAYTSAPVGLITARSIVSSSVLYVDKAQTEANIIMVYIHSLRGAFTCMCVQSYGRGGKDPNNGNEKAITLRNHESD